MNLLKLKKEKFFNQNPYRLGRDFDWFYSKYYNGGQNLRYWTFQVTMNLMRQIHKNPIIIETGCQREDNDFGSGMSTSIFSEYISNYGGELHSVDISPDSVEFSESLSQRYRGIKSKVYLSDSVSWLENYNGECDVLYLDSYDFPFGDMVSVYGETEVWKIDESKIYKEMSDIIDPPQGHCLNEFLSIKNSLKKNTILLLDDCNFPCGGKSGKLIPVLIKDGWKCILEFQQSLWVKDIR